MKILSAGEIVRKAIDRYKADVNDDELTETPLSVEPGRLMHDLLVDHVEDALRSYGVVAGAAMRFQRSIDALNTDTSTWPSRESQAIQDEITAAEEELFAALRSLPEGEKERATVTAQAAYDATVRGRACYIEGWARTDNPYGTSDSGLGHFWDKGWFSESKGSGDSRGGTP